MREVVVVSGVRTAIGTFGGSLKDVPPTPARGHRRRRGVEASASER